MAQSQTSIQNFAGGELGRKMRGRYDLPVYMHGLERCENFIVETQGPARYMPGWRYVVHTRRNKIGAFIKFQFSNQQSYALEFTEGYLRFHKDSGVITEANKTITGITQANPAVVTSNAHGYANGDEVFISGVVGMTQVNGKFFIVAGVAANTFQLTDQDGNNVNSTGYTAYTSGGTAARIYEITTPYKEADDLFKIWPAQTGDVMYLVHPYYEPRKLTRAGHTSWTLALFTRTADPFTSQKVITGATQANPAQITSVGHGLATGNIVIIENVGGMTQLNSRYYTITVTGANTFTLDGVDSTAYTAYTTGGYASLRNLLPSSVTFYEARSAYTGIAADPLAFKLSRSPTNAGVARYDDFTNGTNADDAIEFSIAAEDESATQWIRGNDKFLAIGGFTGVYKITGNADDEAISPTSIKVKRVTAVGSSNVYPLSFENSIVYAEQENLTVRGFEFDALLDNFVSKDRNLVSDDITSGLIKQFSFQSGRPDVAWAVKQDGKLIGMTFKSGEEIFAWHRHNLSGNVLSAVSLPRSNNYDRLWVIVELTVNSFTRHYVGFLEDPVVVPELIEYYTDDEESDKDIFLRAEYEAKKSCFHVHAGASYDGSDSGNSPTTMTPAATTGLGVNFTAGASLFKASDVGREIRKKPVNGVGTGRALIVEYTSATVVKCNITEAFPSTAAMAAGGWFFTTGSLSNLDHLEGKVVSVLADGAVHAQKTVASGAITLDYQASVVQVGIGYKGILKTMNLEVGGVNGPSQTKQKNLYAMGIKFFQTLGAKFGASLYSLEQIDFRSAEDVMDRPPPLFSGEKRVSYEDEWESEKHVVILQENPIPCNVQILVPYVQTNNR